MLKSILLLGLVYHNKYEHTSLFFNFSYTSIYSKSKKSEHPHSVKMWSVIGWSPPYLEFNAQHEVKIILELVAAHMWEGSSYIALKMGVFNKSRASKQAAAAMNLQSVQNSWGFFSSNWNTLRFLKKSTKIQDSYFSVENLNFAFHVGLTGYPAFFNLTHFF